MSFVPFFAASPVVASGFMVARAGGRCRRFRFAGRFDDFRRLLLRRTEDLVPQTYASSARCRRLGGFGRRGWLAIKLWRFVEFALFACRSFVAFLAVVSFGALFAFCSLWARWPWWAIGGLRSFASRLSLRPLFAFRSLLALRSVLALGGVGSRRSWLTWRRRNPLARGFGRRFGFGPAGRRGRSGWRRSRRHLDAQIGGQIVPILGSRFWRSWRRATGRFCSRFATRWRRRGGRLWFGRRCGP
jgi:hypothetical protein